MKLIGIVNPFHSKTCVMHDLVWNQLIVSTTYHLSFLAKVRCLVRNEKVFSQVYLHESLESLACPMQETHLTFMEKIKISHDSVTDQTFLLSVQSNLS